MLNSHIIHNSTCTTPKLIDIIIIGGGLSGLTVAHEIHRTLPSASWKLLEARPILGGRLVNDRDGNEIDLGGVWIWPQQQPHMRKLTSTLNIPTFPQPDDVSSTRIDGGAVQYIHALAKDLPNERILLNTPVCIISMDTAADGDDDELVIQVQTQQHDTLLAKHVVIAVPPKLVSKHIKFDPPLTEEKQRAMAASQTWMAGVTKISLLYATHFWNTESSNMGFPTGGPAFQVYDASTKNVSALTVFAIVPQNSSAANDDNVLADQVASQIEHVWRSNNNKSLNNPPFAQQQQQQAKSYTHVHVKRWPLETYISEDAKPTSINPHPHPVRALSKNEWDNKLLFAGSESDRTSPGVMEGAVGAATRVVNELQAIFGKK
jgi:monoamine oxidase